MSHRVIGLKRLKVEAGSRGGATLDRLSSLIDWQPIGALLSPLYPSSKGEPAWPPLAMFKALLLAVWHDLSDVKVAEALEDRASFRRFCGFAADEPTPRCGGFWRRMKRCWTGCGRRREQSRYAIAPPKALLQRATPIRLIYVSALLAPKFVCRHLRPPNEAAKAAVPLASGPQ